MPAFQRRFNLPSSLCALVPQRDRSSPLWHSSLFCFASLLFQGTPRLSLLPLEVTGSGGGKAREDGENMVVPARESLPPGRAQRHMSAPTHNAGHAETLRNAGKPSCYLLFFHPCCAIHYWSVS